MTSSRALGLLAGVALDAALGDPQRWHPVAGFGRAAGAVETAVWRDTRLAGSVFWVACVVPVAAAGVAVSRAVAGRPAASLALTAGATWAVLGGRSLDREAGAIARSLSGGGLEAARARLPSLCGRDPSALDAAGLARAVVESVAENASDAVVAPLLWGAVFGIPGLLGYRAVNTLDAMVGHRSPRYARFGWASARIDDVANWVPARVTGVLASLLAPLAGGRVDAAVAVLRRDGAAHPSPNAGRCEAAWAGALGVRLGGRNVYAGRVDERPALGDGAPPSVSDIGRAVRLLRGVTVVAGAVACAVAVVR